jgi:hypothetical protein
MKINNLPPLSLSLSQYFTLFIYSYTQNTTTYKL